LNGHFPGAAARPALYPVGRDQWPQERELWKEFCASHVGQESGVLIDLCRARPIFVRNPEKNTVLAETHEARPLRKDWQQSMASREILVWTFVWRRSIQVTIERVTN
jgi:hypothetical protein